MVRARHHIYKHLKNSSLMLHKKPQENRLGRFSWDFIIIKSIYQLNFPTRVVRTLLPFLEKPADKVVILEWG